MFLANHNALFQCIIIVAMLIAMNGYSETNQRMEIVVAMAKAWASSKELHGKGNTKGNYRFSFLPRVGGSSSIIIVK